jgi:hypothetical protein
MQETQFVAEEVLRTVQQEQPRDRVSSYSTYVDMLTTDWLELLALVESHINAMKDDPLSDVAEVYDLERIFEHMKDNL